MVLFNPDNAFSVSADFLVSVVLAVLTASFPAPGGTKLSLFQTMSTMQSAEHYIEQFSSAALPRAAAGKEFWPRQYHSNGENGYAAPGLQPFLRATMWNHMPSTTTSSQGVPTPPPAFPASHTMPAPQYVRMTQHPTASEAAAARYHAGASQYGTGTGLYGMDNRFSVGPSSYAEGFDAQLPILREKENVMTEKNGVPAENGRRYPAYPSYDGGRSRRFDASDDQQQQRLYRNGSAKTERRPPPRNGRNGGVPPPPAGAATEELGKRLPGTEMEMMRTHPNNTTTTTASGYFPPPPPPQTNTRDGFGSIPFGTGRGDGPMRNSGPGANLKAPVWSAYDLPPIVSTENYEEHPDIKDLTPDQIRDLYRQMEVTVQGVDPPAPALKFEHAPFPEWIIEALYKSGYQAPYPVQALGWLVALKGRDMIGIAKTGSGKTLAYLLPAIVHIQKQPPLAAGDGPIALVLAPTRELAMQIDREARRFAALARQSVACVYGGVSRFRQAAALRRGVHIGIVTPGRLLDFLEAGVTNLRRVTYLVLDEADRMLDMGFEPQIRSIVSQVRPDRQTLMWSATWPKTIQQLARELCRASPVRVTVGCHELQANENIRQVIEVCTAAERFQRLLEHLRMHFREPQHEHRVGMQSKVLVFCETKRGCDALLGELRAYRAEFGGVNAIHGDKDQTERDRALAEFKSGRCNTLIATDVASRGLDIKGVGLVINYDIPKTVEGYIHRIGRTGRAGAVGTAVTLFSDTVVDTERARMAKELSGVMVDVGQTPPPELLVLAANAPDTTGMSNQYGFRGGRGGRGYHHNRWGTPHTSSGWQPPSRRRPPMGGFRGGHAPTTQRRLLM